MQVLFFPSFLQGTSHNVVVYVSEVSDMNSATSVAINVVDRHTGMCVHQGFVVLGALYVVCAPGVSWSCADQKGSGCSGKDRQACSFGCLLSTICTIVISLIFFHPNWHCWWFGPHTPSCVQHLVATAWRNKVGTKRANMPIIQTATRKARTNTTAFFFISFHRPRTRSKGSSVSTGSTCSLCGSWSFPLHVRLLDDSMCRAQVTPCLSDGTA